MYGHHYGWSTNLCHDVIMKDQLINEIMKDPPIYVFTLLKKSTNLCIDIIMKDLLNYVLITL